MLCGAVQLAKSTMGIVGVAVVVVVVVVVEEGLVGSMMPIFGRFFFSFYGEGEGRGRGFSFVFLDWGEDGEMGGGDEVIVLSR